MAQLWKERLDPTRHRDFMSGRQDAGGLPIPVYHDSLQAQWVYFVRVHGFTFAFSALDQIATARGFFNSTLRVSDRGGNPPCEHYWQQWFKRLPASILKGSKRQDVLKALDKALVSGFPDP